MIGASRWATMCDPCVRLSTGLRLREQSNIPSPTKARQKFPSLFLVAYLLHWIGCAISHVESFLLCSPAPPLLCYPLHAAAGALHPLSAALMQQGLANTDAEVNAGGAAISASEGASGAAQLLNTGITAPMRHKPRGARVMPGFPVPQFVSLGPSIRYRLRLRRHRRDEGWEFSNLPGKRKFFAARRNHRDQLMHSWMYSRHKQCKTRAKDILNELRSQSRQIFEQSECEAVQEMQLLCNADEDETVVSGAVQYTQDKNLCGNVPFGDCIAAVRAALQACPPPEALRTMSAEALGQLHTTLRELVIDAIIAVAPPESVASAASLGFSLPPATAAVAASPLPWWNSGGGLQPWRGRKEARAQQSRRVNWASPRRLVEPTVAGVLLPREASAVVAAERKARSEEVLDALRTFLASHHDAPKEGNARSLHLAAPRASTASPSMASLPWFISGEQDRLQNLLKCTNASGELDKRRIPGKPTLESTKVQAGEMGGTAEQRQSRVGDVYGLRRALGAAIDVALLLSEATITKKCGAAAPYVWNSPFLRSAASSRRRRRRKRGMPPPEERLPSRQARRLANRGKRLAA